MEETTERIGGITRRNRLIPMFERVCVQYKATIGHEAERRIKEGDLEPIDLLQSSTTFAINALSESGANSNNACD